jgi:hypothetical protein
MEKAERLTLIFLGRYPIHFHLAQNQSQSYIIGNSLHNNYQRSCTIHGSHSVLVKNNVAYLTKYESTHFPGILFSWKFVFLLF